MARELAEIPDLFESATREAVSAFGRGECFVERYLDRPRHVETQCLADAHGNVVVISTRDCSLQRRHQKLVEEAPAPFLIAEQVDRLSTASKAILIEAGYVGAGTCEFLVGQDGTISFLEVNTRLQVEHPVSEEVSGLDLVREMFRIAEGEPLGYDDPVPRGHSIEFRINAEDAGRGFMPAPGTLTAWQPPTGPGRPGRRGLPSRHDRARCLRLPGRQDHRQRGRPPAAPSPGPGGRWPSWSSRACRPWCRSTGPSSTIPPSPPPTAASGCTRGGSRPSSRSGSLRTTVRSPRATGSSEKTRVVVEVDGKRLEVVLPAGVRRRRSGRAVPGRAPGGPPGARGPAATGPSGDTLTSPMQGTIVKVAVAEGDAVETGDLVVVLEAMKMEQPLNAHRAGIDHRPERRGRRHGHQRLGAVFDRRRLTPVAARCRGPKN